MIWPWSKCIYQALRTHFLQSWCNKLNFDGIDCIVNLPPQPYLGFKDTPFTRQPNFLGISYEILCFEPRKTMFILPQNPCKLCAKLYVLSINTAWSLHWFNFLAFIEFSWIWNWAARSAATLTCKRPFCTVKVAHSNNTNFYLGEKIKNKTKNKNPLCWKVTFAVLVKALCHEQP